MIFHYIYTIFLTINGGICFMESFRSFGDTEVFGEGIVISSFLLAGEK